MPDMKLFLSTDFEGTSGIVAWEQIIEGSAEYEQGRRLLTDEVNAVINGAADQGDRKGRPYYTTSRPAKASYSSGWACPSHAMIRITTCVTCTHRTCVDMPH